MTQPPNLSHVGRLITAIDTKNLAHATNLITRIAPHTGLIKLGLEFFLANGPAALAIVNENPLFLDLKLHDIPNTVASAIRALAPVGAKMLTIHAAGGPAMIQAARQAAEDSTAPTRPAILAVTVLTSLDAETLHQTGISGGTTQQTLRLARLALNNGADGLICSAHELRQLRDAFGETPILVTPGIRPAGADTHDQSRIATPQAAITNGANFIVIGRPITQSPNPAETARQISASIQ